MQMALMNMIRKRTLDTILMKRFDCFSHSDAFMNALVENVHRHAALAQNPAEIKGPTTERKIKDGKEKKDGELINPLPSETELSSKVSNYSSMALGGPRPVAK